MGRPPAPWLAKAYDLLADGQWHPREEILAGMMPAVSVGRALRRGQQMARVENLSKAEYIRRGARHLCITALHASVYLESKLQGGVPWVRMPIEDRPAVVPRLLKPVPEPHATHVILPIKTFHALADADLDGALDYDDVEYVTE